MIKPEDIKSITFEQSVFSGYKKEDVDAFLDKMYDDVSKLYKENAELVQKLKVCVGKIEEYRQDEQFLKAAIVNAQKLNETALKEIALKKQQQEESSKASADKLIADAQEQADTILSEAEKRVAEFREKTTADFAQKYKQAEDDFNERKKQLAQEIAREQEVLSALQHEAATFKTNALNLYNEQIARLETLDGEVRAAFESAPAAVEEPVEKISEPQPESADEPEEITEEALEAEEPVAEENPAEKQPETAEELETDAFVESLVETVVEQEPQAEHSPVEPSPLFFSSDIDENAEDPEEFEQNEHSKKRYKNLKFGIGFDVNSEK